MQDLNQTSKTQYNAGFIIIYVEFKTIMRRWEILNHTPYSMGEITLFNILN